MNSIPATVERLGEEYGGGQMNVFAAELPEDMPETPLPALRRIGRASEHQPLPHSRR
jgi:hypothetical protein